MTPAAQRRAFLSMIAASEGTSTSPATRDRGYDVIVSGPDGPEVFTDYSDHPFAHGRPPKLVRPGLHSTASGRYQIMLRDWPTYKRMLNLHDFGPISQDLYAIQLIRERGALPLIDGGAFSMAVQRVSNLWASLPFSNAGQPTNKLATLQIAFLKSGGMVTA